MSDNTLCRLIFFGCFFATVVLVGHHYTNKDIQEVSRPIVTPDGWIITDSYDHFGSWKRKLIDPDGLEYRLNEETFKRDAGIILESLGYPAAEMGFY